MRQPFRFFVLCNPSRIVLDVETTYRHQLRSVRLLDVDRYAVGTPPYTRDVTRYLPAVGPGVGVLHQLFAGPTYAEYLDGLRVVRSGATLFAGLQVREGVARLG